MSVLKIFSTLLVFCFLYIIMSLHIITYFSYFAPTKLLKKEEQSYTSATKLLTLKQTFKIQTTYWQEWVASNSSHFYFYSAFYDNRTTVSDAPVIRIVAMKNNHKESALNYFCQIQFDDNTTITKPVLRFEQLNNHNRKTLKLQAFLITCELGGKYRDQIPKYISVTDNEQAQNRLHVNYSPLTPAEVKENFALCLKGFYFPDKDISSYLVQWFELLFLMGVHKIFIYIIEVHPNILKVLKYYESKDKIQITQFTLPIKLQKNKLKHFLTTDNVIKLHTEHIPYNDCFYKNMNFYKYIAILDYDEIIIPRHDYRWIGMINRSVENSISGTPSAYSFGRYLSMDSMQLNIPKLPKSNDVMKILYKTRSNIVKGVKTILNSDKIVGVSIHEPSVCISGSCQPSYINEDIGFVVHYRSNCKAGQEKLCSTKTIRRDIPIFRYKNILMKNVENALNSVWKYDLSSEIVSNNTTVDMIIAE